MRFEQWIGRLLFLILMGKGLAALGQDFGVDNPDKGASTEVKLVFSAQTVKPGERFWAGIRMKMESGWHTYWRNGGDSGSPTAVKWALPKGLQVEPMRWPVPSKLIEGDMTTYIYEGDVILLTPMVAASDVAAGELEVSATVSWIECKVNCVVGKQTVKGKLAVGTESKPSADAVAVSDAVKNLPGTNLPAGFEARWEMGASNRVRYLVMEWTPQKGDSTGDFYPYNEEDYTVDLQTGGGRIQDGKIQLRRKVTSEKGVWTNSVRGLLVEKSGGKVVFASEPAIQPGGKKETASQTGGATRQESKPVWFLLFLAFCGGLILNVMPCVLPVVALKILGFVKQSKENPRRVRQLGLIYALGVMVSFLAFAIVVGMVRAAGREASWGMQFGNPIFLICLMALVLLVSMNLFGLFEVILGGKAMDAAADLSSREGASGAFFNGVLATVLATPCTAPFLGVSIGFAFSQPFVIVALFFMTAGLGLAFPYVLLSWNPAWLRFLPKPGMWMERFKVAMGFPMMATVVWLYSLVEPHYGEKTWWAGLFLVLVACAAWIYGEFIQRGRKGKMASWIVVLLLLVGGYAFALENRLNWRHPGTVETMAWVPWSEEAQERARSEGRVILVDFTAKWCLTCQANKTTSIEVESVMKKMMELNVIPMLGDYTKTPDNITRELKRFGRAGVPLVLVYPKDKTKPPEVLPEILTPTLVLDALEKAAK